jgi:hypothetical protein
VIRLALLVGAGVLAIGAAATSGAARAACAAGLKTRGGHPVHVYCGPATATVQLEGRRVVFQYGTCERLYDGVFVVDLGIAELSPIRPRFRFFELELFATRDGTYRKLPGVVPRVRWNVFRERTTLSPSVVRISGGMTRGSFSGKLENGSRVSGSFTC